MYKKTTNPQTKYIYLDPLPENQPHKYTMIFLHGLGDSAAGFEDSFDSRQGICPKNCRIVLPTAPQAPVTCNGGAFCTSWFDIFALENRVIPDIATIRSGISQDDLKKSVEVLNKLIAEEVKTLPNQDVGRIFIGGFSQGCMVSLATLISWKGDKPLGGVVGLSGLQGLDEPADINLDVIRKIPLFSYHGVQDQVLKFENAETSFKYLRENIYTGEFSQNYNYQSEKNLAHSVSLNEMNLVKMWISSKINEIDGKFSKLPFVGAVEEEKKQSVGESSVNEDDLSQEQKMMQKAFDFKDQGNLFFKQKDYKKAIGKYCRVQLYIKPLAPPENTGGEADPSLSMVQNMKQFTISADEMEKCKELQGTTFLNLAVCHFLQKDYNKSIENASKSLEYKKTIKGYYRLGCAQKALQKYDQAVEAFKKAVMLDVSDPNDIQIELNRCEKQLAAQRKQSEQNMAKALQRGMFGGNDNKKEEENKE